MAVMSDATQARMDNVVSDAQAAVYAIAEAQYVKSEPIRNLHDLFLSAFDFAFAKEFSISGVTDMADWRYDGWQGNSPT